MDCSERSIYARYKFFRNHFPNSTVWAPQIGPNRPPEAFQRPSEGPPGGLLGPPGEARARPYGHTSNRPPQAPKSTAANAGIATYSPSMRLSHDICTTPGTPSGALRNLYSSTRRRRHPHSHSPPNAGIATYSPSRNLCGRLAKPLFS